MRLSVRNAYSMSTKSKPYLHLLMITVEPFFEKKNPQISTLCINFLLMIEEVKKPRTASLANFGLIFKFLVFEILPRELKKKNALLIYYFDLFP